MFIKNPLTSVLFATLFVIFAFTPPTAQADTGPLLRWAPAAVETTVFRSAARIIEIALLPPEKEIENITIEIVPELSPFVKVFKTSFNSKLPTQATSTIQLSISVPAEQPLGSIEGTVKIKQGNRSIAKPLPLTLHIVDSEPATRSLENYLVDKFGITTPLLADAGAVIPLSQETIDEFSQGSGLPLVFKSGSLHLLGSWSEEADANTIKNNVRFLLSLLQEKTVNTQPLLTALGTTVYVRDDPKKTVLPCGADATNFYPTPVLGLGLIPIDTDCDDRADTYVLIFEIYNYTVFRPDYLDVIKNGLLFEGDVDKKNLNLPAKIALHELTHATHNITLCNIKFFFTPGLDESYTRKIEDLFYWIIPYRGEANDTVTINHLYQQAKDLISPNLSCLEMLNLIPPTFQGELNITFIGADGAALSWIPSDDQNFESYRIYRSPTSGTGIFGQLVAVMPNRVNTGPNEQPEERVGAGVGGLQPETTYYFTVFIFDKTGLTVGSNEVSITTLPLIPVLPEEGGGGGDGGTATSTPSSRNSG